MKKTIEPNAPETLFNIAPPIKAKPKRIQVDFKDLRLKEGDESGADQVYVHRLAGSIHLWSLMNPLIVTRKGKSFVIEAGKRRYLAITQLIEGGLVFHDGTQSTELNPQATRFAKIPCVILPDLPGGDAARASITLMENQMRRANPLAELDALLTLRGEGKDEKTITRLTGMPSAIQRKRLRLHNLSSQMRRAMNEGLLSNSNALRVASLTKGKQKEVWKNYQSRIKADDREPTGREKITNEDISSVKRVQVQEALAGIAEVFAVGPTAAPTTAPTAAPDETVVKILREMASQKLTSEMEPDEDGKVTGDFETAYDFFISNARTALKIVEPVSEVV